MVFYRLYFESAFQGHQGIHIWILHYRKMLVFLGSVLGLRLHHLFGSKIHSCQLRLFPAQWYIWPFSCSANFATRPNLIFVYGTYTLDHNLWSVFTKQDYSLLYDTSTQLIDRTCPFIKFNTMNPVIFKSSFDAKFKLNSLDGSENYTYDMVHIIWTMRYMDHIKSWSNIGLFES